MLCALWEYGPRSPSTGEPIEVEDLRTALAESQTAVDLVVPLAATRRAGDRFKEAGNRLLMVADEDREAEALAHLATADETVLASHLLELHDIETIQNAGAPDAISRRNARINKLQTSFLDRMCEWEQEDTPDLVALEAAEAMIDAPS